MNRHSLLALLLSSVFSVVTAMEAQTIELFEVASGSRTFFCHTKGSTYVAGLLAKTNNTSTFTSYATEIKKIQRSILRATGKKKTSLQKKLKTYKARQKTDNPVCALGPPIQTPTPLPTSSPGSGVFDPLGNVTETGKNLLQIPSGLSANISRGKTVYLSNCVGCHIERTNRTFSDLRFNTSRPPMFFNEQRLTDIDLADLTAYLNRFRA